MSSSDPTSRFSDRVADYVRTRPGYPPEVLDLLRREGLTPDVVIADVGSGTGLSAEMFLKAGHTVYGVEPNREMREAAESRLAGYPSFHSVTGTAEATTLPTGSIGAVVAGQAFHWFDTAKARDEFSRILRPPGIVVLLWNTRKLDTTPFLRAYEALLHRFGTDYKEVVHTNVDRTALRAFFGGDFEARVLPNEQMFDREGLRGRLRSSSYTPPPGHPNHEPMLRELDHIFDVHARGGTVRFEYDTELYFRWLATTPTRS
ncbi:MAG TPA: class I SAM-dependent methyltransferase [Gemmataceae bacterium]|nr:class I SAM-dependent methyltransferase [Gemmataceae bacterium]